MFPRNSCSKDHRRDGSSWQQVAQRQLVVVVRGGSWCGEEGMVGADGVEEYGMVEADDVEEADNVGVVREDTWYIRQVLGLTFQQ